MNRVRRSRSRDSDGSACGTLSTSQPTYLRSARLRGFYRCIGIDYCVRRGLDHRSIGCVYARRREARRNASDVRDARDGTRAAHA